MTCHIAKNDRTKSCCIRPVSRVTFYFAIREHTYMFVYILFCIKVLCILHTCIHIEDAIKPIHNEQFAYDHNMNQLHMLLGIRSACAFMYLCVQILIYYYILYLYVACTLFCIYSINIVCICVSSRFYTILMYNFRLQTIQFV